MTIGDYTTQYIGNHTAQFLIVIQVDQNGLLGQIHMVVAAQYS